MRIDLFFSTNKCGTILHCVGSVRLLSLFLSFSTYPFLLNLLLPNSEFCIELALRKNWTLCPWMLRDLYQCDPFFWVILKHPIH